MGLSCHCGSFKKYEWVPCFLKKACFEKVVKVFIIPAMMIKNKNDNNNKYNDNSSSNNNSTNKNYSNNHNDDNDDNGNNSNSNTSNISNICKIITLLRNCIIFYKVSW